MWISNPLTHSLFAPIASTLAALLSCGLLALLAGLGLTEDRKLRAQLLMRWFSWLAIAIIGVSSVFAGALSFTILTTLISVICMAEYCSICKMERAQTIVLLLIAAAMPAITMVKASFLLPAAVIGSMLVIAYSLIRALSFSDTAIRALAVFYIPLLASHAVALYQSTANGPALVLTVLTSSALANIAAYVFGKAFGGPKLSPQLSPNKTWSGAIGSVAGAYLGFLILASAGNLQPTILMSVLLPFVVAVMGIFGDLFESSLKRFYSVKDAGTWLPGFGGALDRVDGLLFVLPCVYYLSRLV